MNRLVLAIFLSTTIASIILPMNTQFSLDKAEAKPTVFPELPNIPIPSLKTYATVAHIKQRFASDSPIIDASKKLYGAYVGDIKAKISPLFASDERLTEQLNDYVVQMVPTIYHLIYNDFCWAYAEEVALRSGISDLFYYCLLNPPRRATQQKFAQICWERAVFENYHDILPPATSIATLLRLQTPSSLPPRDDATFLLCRYASNPQYSRFIEHLVRHCKANPDGNTSILPLEAAIESENSEGVLALLVCGANPNRLSPANGCTPAHTAIRMTPGQKLLENLLTMLHTHGADLNKQDSNYGDTPFHYAAKCNRLNITATLLACDANPSIRNKKGQTVLDVVRSKADCYCSGDIEQMIKEHTIQEF